MFHISKAVALDGNGSWQDLLGILELKGREAVCVAVSTSIWAPFEYKCRICYHETPLALYLGEQGSWEVWR